MFRYLKKYFISTTCSLEMYYKRHLNCIWMYKRERTVHTLKCGINSVKLGRYLNSFSKKSHDHLQQNSPATKVGCNLCHFLCILTCVKFENGQCLYLPQGKHQVLFQKCVQLMKNSTITSYHCFSRFG